MKYIVIEPMQIFVAASETASSVGTLLPGFKFDAEPTTASPLWLEDANGFFYLRKGTQEINHSPFDSSHAFDYHRLLLLPAELHPFKGEGVKIAILDSGFHHQAAFEGQIIKYYNVRHPNAPLAVLADNDHGTMVSGLIASRLPNQAGIQGVAPMAKHIWVDVGDTNGYVLHNYVLAGLKWLAKPENRPDIINMSFKIEPRELNDEFNEVLLHLKGSGVVLIAAGKSEMTESISSKIDFPANHTAVMGVASMATHLTKIDFPISPDIDFVMANHVFTSTGVQAANQQSGSSFAAALVSGSLARVISYQRHHLLDYNPANFLKAMLSPTSHAILNLNQLNIYKNENL